MNVRVQRNTQGVRSLTECLSSEEDYSLETIYLLFEESYLGI
jgi:hypothetical protein